LEKESPRIDANILGNGVGLLQQGLPLTDGHDVLGIGEGEQLVKSPHAAEPERFVTPRPHFLKVAEPSWRFDSIPVVANIEQIAAFATGNADFVRTIGLPALRGNATLIGEISERHGLTICYDKSSYYDIGHWLSLR
jgi:hypothetical protein